MNQSRDTRIRVKATKSILAIGIEAGKVYLMSPADAYNSHMIGWGEILDQVPGFNAPLVRPAQ